MHRLPDNSIATRDLGHRRAIQDLADRLIPLLHHAEPLAPPAPFAANIRSDETKPLSTEQTESVVDLPEPLSPTYRNRVRTVSPATEHDLSSMNRARTVRRIHELRPKLRPWRSGVGWPGARSPPSSWRARRDSNP